MLQPATLSETVTVTATAHRAAAGRRAGQRQRADPGRHPALARRRRRRRAAADSDVQPVPPHQQPVVASDRAGRVAARHRAERRQPHAGAARRRAVQRSVRRLGVLDARAARGRRSHRGRRQRQLEPVRQLRDGRRHQHHDRGRRCAARSRSSRSTATAAARRWTSAPATSGARSAWSFDGSAFRPTAFRSWWRPTRPASPSAASSTTTRGRVPQLQRQG